MPISIRKNITLGNYAGLAIHHDCLRFTELDPDGTIIRQEKVQLEEGCIQNGVIKDFALLEAAFNQLHNTVGRMREPIVIGIPYGETIIRPLNLPDMSIDDVRGTLDLNFDEYFPYPRSDAVFDTIRVFTPEDAEGREEITVIAASAKRETIEKLLDLARKTGLPAGAVEPLSFALLRSIPEANEGMSIFANPTTVIAIFNGSGISFRSANNLQGAQDILNTMQFIETTYRGIRVRKLILSGLNFQVSADTGLELVNIEDEYFAAKGLALRNEPDAQRLDLRPSEYVELERRRYSFNPNRLIFWGLLIGFIMLSIGTISFAWMRIRDLDLALEDKRISNTDLLTRRAELARSNADLEKKRKDTERVLDFLKSDIPVLEILNAFEANAADGLKFEEADFSRNAAGIITVTIDGKAANEDAILNTTEGLKRCGLFDDVRLPISLRAMTGQTVFKIILRVKGAE